LLIESTINDGSRRRRSPLCSIAQVQITDVS